MNRTWKHGRSVCCCFFFNDTATTEIYTLSLHDALPILAAEGLHDKMRRLFNKSYIVEKPAVEDRKSTRLNSSHRTISYAVFCLKKKKTRLGAQTQCAAEHSVTSRHDDTPSLRLVLLRLGVMVPSRVVWACWVVFFFFFNDTATPEIYTLSLHGALPISPRTSPKAGWGSGSTGTRCSSRFRDGSRARESRSHRRTLFDGSGGGSARGRRAR